MDTCSQDFPETGVGAVVTGNIIAIIRVMGDFRVHVEYVSLSL
jgi:hypothetical protein